MSAHVGLRIYPPAASDTGKVTSGVYWSGQVDQADWGEAIESKTAWPGQAVSRAFRARTKPIVQQKSMATDR
jgi:hypothetical protein